jgi:hypothetical protein
MGMRPFGSAGLSLLLLAGCATSHEVHYPPGIPYACEGGREARVVYEDGGWFVRARAHLQYDGRAVELKASPPTFGLRYVSADDAADPILIWSVQGERAWLSEIARDAAGDTPEHPIATCARLREGGEAPVEPPAH